MVRPRWHDLVIVSTIVAILAAGVWALWWEDVRAALQLGPGRENPPTPGRQPQT
jgi:hypothetical protein